MEYNRIRRNSNGVLAHTHKGKSREKNTKERHQGVSGVLLENISPDDTHRLSIKRSAAALRNIAVLAPGEIKAANVQKLLVKQLKYLEYEDRIVRKTGAELLDKLGWQPSNDAERINYLIAKEEWDGLAEMGKPAVKSLIRCLEDKEPDVRVNAARTLGQIGDVKAIKPLLLSWQPFKEDQILWDYYDTLLPVVVKALTNIGKSDVKQLIKRVKDETEEGSGWFVLPAVWALCEIGDSKATEAVVDWVFLCGQIVPMVAGYIIRFHDFDKRLLSSADFIRSRVPPEVLRKLLGGYADLILDIFTWRTTTDPEQFDVSRCNEAIQRLCMIRTPVSSNILHKVAKIGGLTVSSEWGWEVHTTKYLDFKSQRHMAKEELKRRGKPRYDPSAYLTQDAWKL